MGYLIEIETTAGMILLGVFSTLEAARTYAGKLGMIRPLFAPTIPAADLIELTVKELENILESA